VKYPLLMLLAFLFTVAQKNNRVEIIHADTNSGRVVEGEQLRILNGHVHIRKDSVHLYCDEAVFYSRQDFIRLTGRVRIDNGLRKLRGPFLDYYPKTDIAEAYGGVTLTDAEDTLYARRLRYDMKTDTVRAEEKMVYLNGPRCIRLSGERAFYNRTRARLHVWENARFEQRDSSTLDTLHIRAGHFFYFKTPNRYLYARDSVVVTKGSFHARADSMRYVPDEEMVYLMGRPRVTVEKNLLLGSRIRALLDSNAVKHVWVNDQARALSPRDSLSGLKNRLSGKEIELFIEDKKPVLIIARENAGSRYFVESETEKGENRATADSIYVFFREGKADSIVVSGGVRGTYYPDSYKGERKD